MAGPHFYLVNLLVNSHSLPQIYTGQLMDQRSITSHRLTRIKEETSHNCTDQGPWHLWPGDQTVYLCS